MSARDKPIVHAVRRRVALRLKARQRGWRNFRNGECRRRFAQICCRGRRYRRAVRSAWRRIGHIRQRFRFRLAVRRPLRFLKPEGKLALSFRNRWLAGRLGFLVPPIRAPLERSARRTWLSDFDRPPVAFRASCSFFSRSFRSMIASDGMRACSPHLGQRTVLPA